MRKAGYHFQSKIEREGELALTRPPRGYPRFHLFVRVEGENLIFNLHLDQKRPIYPVRSPSRCERDGRRLRRLTSSGVYKGATAHAGEYDGEVVEKEAKRIKQIPQAK